MVHFLAACWIVASLIYMCRFSGFLAVVSYLIDVSVLFFSSWYSNYSLLFVPKHCVRNDAIGAVVHNPLHLLLLWDFRKT